MAGDFGHEQVKFQLMDQDVSQIGLTRIMEVESMKAPKRLERSALQDSVVARFRQTGSLEATADHLSISAYKVRKILITTGEWSSPFSVQVAAMKKSGMSIARIAETLNASANLVSAYLPYEKAIYNVPDRTHVANRSDRYINGFGALWLGLINCENYRLM